MGIKFSDRELTVMELLWERGSCTVREAKDALDDDLAYTSVLSAFQGLEDKGHVSHEKEGRAYRYYPAISREEAQTSALDQVIERLFGGSSQAAVTRLLETNELDADAAARAREEVEKYKEDQE